MTTVKRRLTRIPSCACPDCGSKLTTRTSGKTTATTRDLLMVCENDSCGARFAGQLVLVHRIVATVKPNPAVHLPSREWQRPANDDRVPANDGPASDLPPAATSGDPMTG